MTPNEAIQILARITEQTPMIPAICHQRDEALSLLNNILNNGQVVEEEEVD